jgi:putative ABC transport system permease protein
MFTNTFKITLRNLIRDFSYSLINILGLSIGITGSLFLILYIYDDLSFDRYHEKADRIFRISSRITEPDDAFNWAVTQVPLAPQIKQDYPEVEEATRLIQSGRHLYKYEEKEFFEEEVSYADSTVFDIFTWPLVEGDPRTALTRPNSIVLTRSFSERYFGKESPIGKVLQREDDNSYTVTGLMEDIPKTSNYIFSALISKNSLPEDFGSWGAFHIFTYILLREGADYKALEAKLPEMYKNYMAEIFERMGINIVYELLPITRIHLHSDFEGEPVAVGNVQFIYIFLVIIVFLLVIASINYMNLATARSTKRSKEVGIRKVAGSSRSVLIRQFLAESLMLTIISLVISLLLCYLLLPTFNNLSGKFIDFSIITSPVILLCLFAVIILTGLAGGSYPALLLSGFNPAEILRGQHRISGSGLTVRKILVIIQFTISTAMLISTWIVYNQLNYLKNKDLGFTKENVITLRLTTREMVKNLPVFREALLTKPGILSVGSANNNVGYGTGKTIIKVETVDGMVERGINNFAADHGFIKSLGITLLEGSDFSEDIPSDTTKAVIINETLAKRLNWDDPIGKKVQFPRDTTSFATVVGLIKDYQQFGLYNEMESLMLLYYPTCYVVFIKTDGKDMEGKIEFIKEKWNELYSRFPFDYKLLNEEFDEQFRTDEKRGIIYAFFAILTVLIACLGLFGLASFVTEQRTKEVGVRKVFGANVSDIVSLMLRSYLFLVGISILVASAVSYYFATKWLESFVYRTEIRWTTFLLAALITIVITLITVSLHTIRAGNLNPAESLRNE